MNIDSEQQTLYHLIIGLCSTHISTVERERVNNRPQRAIHYLASVPDAPANSHPHAYGNSNIISPGASTHTTTAVDCT